ncbi:PREDICTED: uncharacterized protein LOC109465853 [Branchiostoma belcheri]|uniref:Uncharacterized protein LOC109465853 n=1 Tax=Branchiostoma belcheri TaxID=7741 RepID=A0A6P4XQH6_BRABE|nr:PREDICTED: uncharacterized protein LOC109465853 [Branchiostoma belcheri]
MPYALVRTNFDVEEEFDGKLSKLMSDLFKVEEEVVSVEVLVNKRMLRNGTNERYVYCDLRRPASLMTTENKVTWAKVLSDFFMEQLRVEPLRCTLSFRSETM